MLNKIFCLLIIFIIQFTILNSQDTWLHTYDPFYEAIFSVEDVIVCSDGGYAVNGTCIDQETTIGWGFVIKTDCYGNLTWANKDTVDFQPENDSRAFVETEDGGFLSSSHFWGNGTALIKRDEYGDIIDSELLDDMAIHSMCNTNDNKIMAAGYSRIDNEYWPMLMKINQNAVEDWSNIYPFESYEWGIIKSVIQSSDGGFLLTGYLKDNETENAILAIKTDVNGDSLWTRTLDVTPLDDEGYTIIETEDEDIIVGGRKGCLQDSEGFVWKLDTNGNTLWFEECGYNVTSFTNSIDNFVIALYQEPEITLNNGIRKFDSNYTIEWSNDLPYFNGNGDKAVKIIPEGNIIVALITTSSTVALTKLYPDGTDIYNDIAIFPNPILETYPNPFKTTISFSFSLNKTSNMEINVYNLKGQLIYKIKEGFLNYGKHTVCWQSLNLNSGSYFVQLQANNEVLDSKKITLIK